MYGVTLSGEGLRLLVYGVTLVSGGMHAGVRGYARWCKDWIWARTLVYGLDMGTHAGVWTGQW